MNKDVKGLIKYLLFIFFVGLLPVGMFYLAFAALFNCREDGNAFLICLFLLLTLVLFILYIILPVVFTYKAMKNHWSKYLDKFFYHKLWPTIVFILFIFLHSTEHIFHYSDSSEHLLLGIIYALFLIIEIFIAPLYYLPYIILFIMKKCKIKI